MIPIWSDRLSRRIGLWAILVICIFCILCNCQRQPTSPQYTFLVLPRTLSNDFHSSLVAGTRAAAIEEHVALQIYASVSEDDYDFQERYLYQTVTQKNVDGVVITPGHSTKLIPILRQLDNNGIPFIIVDTPLELSNEPPFEHYCGFVGTDNQRGGGLAAEYIGETMPAGNVLLMRGVVSHLTSQDRETGFLATIKRYPKIRIAHIVEGRWNEFDAKDALSTFSPAELATIDAVFAYNDLMALAVAEVFQQYRLRPLIVGYDGILKAQSAIIDGLIDATVTQAPDAMGRRAIAKLRQCIEQKSYHGETELTHVSLLMATRTLTAVSSYDQKQP